MGIPGRGNATCEDWYAWNIGCQRRMRKKTEDCNDVVSGVKELAFSPKNKMVPLKDIKQGTDRITFHLKNIC